MAKFLRKDARMTTAVAPLLSISPRVQRPHDNGPAWSRLPAVRPVPSVWCGGPRFFWPSRREPPSATSCARCTSIAGRYKCGADGGAPSPLSWSTWKPTGAVTKPSPR